MFQNNFISISLLPQIEAVCFGSMVITVWTDMWGTQEAHYTRTKSQGNDIAQKGIAQDRDPSERLHKWKTSRKKDDLQQDLKQGRHLG